MGKSPLVLDFDASVGALAGARVLALAGWQQRIRFGCSTRAMAALRRVLAPLLPADPGPVFLGSGDFHHVSLLLMERLAERGPLDVIVFDNHPDNMRFPWGIHCGSWVSHVARLPFVRHVQVMGITSSDVALLHALENRLLPLWRGRVAYWCIARDVRWARCAGLADAIRGFDGPDAMLDALAEQQTGRDGSVYLSIDKDVLSPRVARTNWDQGCLEERHLHRAIGLLRGRLTGCDITGEVSTVSYAARWKRWLSALDAQPRVDGTELNHWQTAQRALNARLLGSLLPACAAVTGLNGAL